jgi:hypothetical protein
MVTTPHWVRAYPSWHATSRFKDDDPRMTTVYVVDYKRRSAEAKFSACSCKGQCASERQRRARQ